MIIVAMKECSAGNETVGEMWIETATFTADTPLSRVIEWAANAKGRSQPLRKAGRGGRLMLDVTDENHHADQASED